MPESLTPWSIRGQYFENCNCDVVCPCEVSPLGPLKARPDRGVCDVVLAFHLDDGRFGEVRLGGLNVILAIHTPGVMAEGNWTGAPYLDERASPEQRQALGAIFGGAVGGPLARLAPLIAELADLYGDLSRITTWWWGQNFFPRGFPYFLSLYLGPLALTIAAVGAGTRAPSTGRLVLLGLAGVVIALGRWAGLAKTECGLHL